MVSNKVLGGVGCPVSVSASLIKLGTIAPHMCAMLPNNAGPVCIVLGARWMGLPIHFVVMVEGRGEMKAEDGWGSIG